MSETLHAAQPRKKVRAEVIAEQYDVSVRAVYLWAKEGRIPSVRIGKTLRFDPVDVEESLERKGAAK